MSTIAETCLLALRYHQEGHLAQAEQLYRQILQADPHHADAHHLLGVLAYQAKHYDTAISLIQKAIALSPMASPYHSNLGLALEAHGQPELAVASLRHALRLKPDDAAAIDNLGAALMRQGRFQEVVAVCQHVLMVRQDVPQAHQHLAHALSAMGRSEEALAHFEEALRLKPRFVEAHNNLGNLLLQIGRTEEAAEHLRQALELRPDLPAIHNNLGRVLHRQGLLDDAVAQYRGALQLEPGYAQAHNNLGSALAEQRKFDEAIASYRAAIRFDPGLTEAYCNLAAAQIHAEDVDEAIASCRKAIELQPRYALAYNNLGGAYLAQGNLSEAASCFRRALELQPGLITAYSNMLFCLSYDSQADPDAVFAEYCSFGQTFPPPPAAKREAAADILRRLRVGYVSPDFRQHALIRYFEPVLAHHDPLQVEVFCYAEAPQPDEVTTRLQKLAHHWRSIRGLTNVQAAQLIRDDRIDILVDLAGHTAGNRLDVFTLKPAPIQATWLGYLNTTGLSTIDYRLTDDVLDPLGQPVRDSEELFRLQGGFCCFGPWPDAPAVNALPALERGYLTFGAMHNLFKLNARVYDLWSHVLRSVPTSRLVMFRDTLKGTALKNVRREFTQRGIEAKRLDLRCEIGGTNGLRRGLHLRVYGEIDVCLDAFPWTGGVTTCESLWMGVPMLSLVGVRPTARNSASLLAQVGLSDWTCTSGEEFLAMAQELTGRLEYLAELRASLRERMLGTICDAHRFTRVLEQAYRTMWRRYIEGQERNDDQCH